jgi:hypothetical protein
MTKSCGGKIIKKRCWGASRTRGLELVGKPAPKKIEQDGTDGEEGFSFSGAPRFPGGVAGIAAFSIWLVAYLDIM